MQTTINNVEGYVIHASKKRPTDSQYKIQLGDCIDLATWVEEAMASFIADLPKENKQHWNAKKASCTEGLLMINIGTSGPSTSSHPVQIGFTGHAAPSEKAR